MPCRTVVARRMFPSRRTEISSAGPLSARCGSERVPRLLSPARRNSPKVLEVHEEMRKGPRFAVDGGRERPDCILCVMAYGWSTSGDCSGREEDGPDLRNKFLSSTGPFRETEYTCHCVPISNFANTRSYSLPHLDVRERQSGGRNINSF